LTGDPWNGRTLEWATASPPPAYNFAVLPRVDAIDAFWVMKQQGLTAAQIGYQTIEVPRNTATGLVIAFFASATGFALIWHIWWMAALGLAGAAIALLAFGWNEEREAAIPAAEIARMERARSGLRGLA
jgi:cytochrome o ubiquinol oxidase subunit I